MKPPASPAPVRKISIINTFASNGGDAAILFAIIRQVRNQFGSKVRIIIYDQQQKLVSRLFPDCDIRSIFLHRVPDKGSKHWLRLLRLSLIVRFTAAAWAMRWNLSWIARLLLNQSEFRDLADYADSDAIITTGGTYLVENYPMLPKIFGLQIAKVLGKPVIFYTQSLGPFKKPLNRRLVREAVNYADLVLLRDERSRGYLEEIDGVRRDNLVVSSDVVFSFAESEDMAAAAVAAPSGRSLTVGLTVRDWPYFKKRKPDEGMDLYRKSVAAMVTRIVEQHNGKAVFISTCQGIPEYHEIDSNVALEIKAMLPPQVAAAVEVDEDFHRYEELIAVYQKCDLVISTRMHGAIMALSSGTPVLPIAYEFKTTELFGRFGLSEWVLEIETIEPDAAAALLDRYLAELPKFRATLFAGVEQSRRQAEESGDLMRQAVLGHLARAGTAVAHA